MYWTLQTRNREKSSSVRSAAPQDDLNVGQQQYQMQAQNVEDLYSTPNKNRRNQLKTTPLGFDFYSPVPNQLNEVKETEEEHNQENSGSIMSPIDPRNQTAFTTSTPQKNPDFRVMSPTKTNLADELRNRLKLQDSGIRSHGNSPISSGRSTPKGIFEPQSRSRHSWSAQNTEIPQTCSDRLGTPKTSLMDFKKLLLNKNSSTRPGKISAVEQLKLSKSHLQLQKSPTAPAANSNTLNSSMNILDLSGSPKTFATRRMIRQGQFGPNLSNSPSKSLVNATKHAGGKHAWRFQNMRTDVITTAIPEVNSEEDNSSPNASNERTKSEAKSFCDNTDEKGGNSPEKVEKEDKVLNTIFEEKSPNIKDNIFMKEEENNFTKTEIQQQKKSTLNQLYTRAQLQQQRAQFLLGNSINNNNITNNNSSTTNNNNKTAHFKNGHYAGLMTTISPVTTSSGPQLNGKSTFLSNGGSGAPHSTTITIVTTISTPTTNSAITSSAGMNNNATPSLETAL